MTRKERKIPVQLKSIHEFITKGTLTPPNTQPTMKIRNQNDTPQHRSPTDSNNISTASCPLQTDERNVSKELILDPSYSSDIIQDYFEDNILLTNPTEIKNDVDFCQGDNPEQEPRYDNRMIIEISNMNKETVRFLLAPTG